MSLDNILPFLDTLSRFAEGLPFPWIAFAGVCLAAVVAALKGYQKFKAAQAPLAQVIPLPAPQELAPAPPVAPLAVTEKTGEPVRQAHLEDIATATLKE